MSDYWKGGERRAAKKLGGDRIPCSGVGTLKGDVLHDKFFIECKSRMKLSIYPWFTKAVEQAKDEGKNKIPILVVHEKHKQRDLVVIDIKDFVKMLEPKEMKSWAQICKEHEGDCPTCPYEKACLDGTEPVKSPKKAGEKK